MSDTAGGVLVPKDPAGNDSCALRVPDRSPSYEDGPYWSHSRYWKWRTCGEAYRRHYEEGDQEPQDSNRAFGDAVHKCIEFDYREKIQTGKNKPLSEKVDFFIEKLRDEIAKGLVFSGRDTKESLEKTGQVLVKLHHEKIALHTHPKEVEKKVLFSVPGMDIPILGYLDLIEEDPDTGKLYLRDHKTSREPYEKDAADLSIQLGCYSLATAIDDVSYDVLIKSRVPDVVRIPGKITPLFRSYAISELSTSYHAVKARVFPRPMPGKYPCQPGKCYYWSTCVGKYCSGGR